MQSNIPETINQINKFPQIIKEWLIGHFLFIHINYYYQSGCITKTNMLSKNKIPKNKGQNYVQKPNTILLQRTIYFIEERTSGKIFWLFWAAFSGSPI